MNRDLLKKVVPKINLESREIFVPGFSKEEVQAVVDELIENEVVTPVSSIVCTPQIKNGTIRQNTLIPVVKNDKEVEGYNISELKLKEIYKMDIFGRDIE